MVVLSLVIRDNDHNDVGPHVDDRVELLNLGGWAAIRQLEQLWIFHGEPEGWRNLDEAGDEIFSLVLVCWRIDNSPLCTGGDLHHLEITLIHLRNKAKESEPLP